MMEFYVWDYLGFVRAMQTGYAEFRAVGRKTRIGTLAWQSPFVVEMTTSKFGDLCTDGQDILLSDRFRDVWAQSDLTGLEFAEDCVEIVDVEATTPNYCVARIQHTITRLDEDASGAVAARVVGCELCRVMARDKVDRLRLAASTVPEVDVFRPSGLYGATVVTSRFVDLVNEAGLENFHFIHQDDYRES